MAVMAGYKQTEVGEIPKEWGVRKLSDVSLKITDGDHITPKRTAQGYYLLSARNVLNGRIDVSDVDYVGSDEYQRMKQRCGPEAGDVLISCSGTIGRVAVVPIGFECVLVRSAALVKIAPKLVDGVFLQYWLQGIKAQLQITSSVNQGAQPNLFLNHIERLLSPLPPLSEQRAIALALSDVDALLDSLDRLITKKRDLKQAAMQQLLTGQTRMPGFSGEWNQCQVQDVVAGFFCGPSPTCKERNIQDDEWGVLKTTATTKEKGWDWTKHKTLPRIFWNKPHLELQKGDVIVTKAGPRHRVGVASWVDYVPPRIIVSGKMIGLRPRPDRVVALMLSAAISSHETQTYLDQRTTGMAESQVNFENSALLEAPILLPHIDEQKEIAQALTEMDAEITALVQRRAKTLTLKQGMMQELLTGKTRLVSLKEAA